MCFSIHIFFLLSLKNQNCYEIKIVILKIYVIKEFFSKNKLEYDDYIHTEIKTDMSNYRFALFFFCLFQ